MESLPSHSRGIIGQKQPIHLVIIAGFGRMERTKNRVNELRIFGLKTTLYLALAEQRPVVVPGRLCEAATPMVCGDVLELTGSPGC
jgi:hypothetical protein